MKVSRKQLRKIILKEMMDPGTLALGAGVSMGLAALYTYIFGKEPQSEEQAAEAIKQHVDKELEQSKESSDYDPSDYDPSEYYQPKTPKQKWMKDTGIISHRDYWTGLPDHVKRKYGWKPGDDE